MSESEQVSQESELHKEYDALYGHADPTDESPPYWYWLETKVATLEAKLSKLEEQDEIHWKTRRKLLKDKEAHEQRVEGLPEVKISDGDVWLVFPNAMISIESICNSRAPGPIVKRNLRAWRDKALARGEEA